jgi:hypothetical protein
MGVDAAFSRNSVSKKFTSCPTCTVCPEVEITDQGVTIAEAANTVPQRTCVLVKSGELREVEDVPDHLLPYLSPLGWEHINLTGDAVWSPAGEMTERTERVPGCERRDDLCDIYTLGVRCQVADLHVLDHATAKWAH